MKNILILALLSLACNRTPPLHEIQVSLQPYGTVQSSYTEEVKEALEKAYEIPITILQPKELPARAFIQVKSARYRADSIIAIQSRMNSNDFMFTFGITESDISSAKYERGKIKEPHSKYADWGIMGLAYCPGSSAVISTFRIKSGNSNIFISRLRKIAIHEFGHNLGLPHCTYSEQCVMRDAAESIKTIDFVKEELCEHCKQSIRY